MKRYVAIACKDEGSAYGVHFPDLTGCVAAGESLEEAIDNAGIALRLWSEDIDILPEPSPIEVLKTKRDVREDLADGATAILVPLLISGRKQRFNIMLDPVVVEAADLAARTAGLSRSAFIARAIESKINRDLGAVRKRSKSEV